MKRKVIGFLFLYFAVSNLTGCGVMLDGTRAPRSDATPVIVSGGSTLPVSFKSITPTRPAPTGAARKMVDFEVARLDRSPSHRLTDAGDLVGRWRLRLPQSALRLSLTLELRSAARESRPFGDMVALADSELHATSAESLGYERTSLRQFGSRPSNRQNKPCHVPSELGPELCRYKDRVAGYEALNTERSFVIESEELTLSLSTALAMTGSREI